MKTMQAVRIHAYGGPEMLVYEDVPCPQPSDREVLIRVHAAGINPLDWKIRKGLIKDKFPITFPCVLGWDVSGVIDSVGSGVDRLSVGDEVFSCADISRDGAYAEYIVIKESEVALKPKRVDHVHAAAMPMVGLTAWQSLYDAAQLAAGQRVLIHGATGGVGHLAVQMAKWTGAYVVGTAAERNHDFLRALGADRIIDYDTERFEDVSSPWTWFSTRSAATCRHALGRCSSWAASWFPS